MTRGRKPPGIPGPCRRHGRPGCEALYILGDLFEYWLGDDAPTPAGRAVAGALAGLAGPGVQVYFLHGNRDFLLGEPLCRTGGLQLLPEEQVVELYGRPTLLLHGDTLCTDDVAYQQVRSPCCATRTGNANSSARHPDERVRLALEARELSADHKQGVSMEIMDVNEQAVLDAFERNHVRHMIHGHTHRPGVHQHQRPAALPCGAYWATGTNRAACCEWMRAAAMLPIE